MTWSFLPVIKPLKTMKPADNKSDKILVEPNERGGWSMRFAGDPISERIGNYATPQDAERIARANCTHVEVVAPKAQTVASDTVVNRSVAKRLEEIGIPAAL